MTIPLVANWRRVLKRAWSMWFVYAAVLVLALDLAVDWASGNLTLSPDRTIALRIASLILMVLSVPARIVLQKVFHDE